MKRFYPAVLIAVLAFLAACDTQSPQEIQDLDQDFVVADSAYARLIDGIGGREALLQLLSEASHEELEATFARYGMGFEVIDRSLIDEENYEDDTRNIQSCPQFFPTADRTKWFRLIGAGGPEDHYIDSRGRPLIAVKSLGPIVTAPRQTTCQTNVGHWGAAGDTYDGGHLIGSQLGGWGGRANLVPQQFNFNRGNWVRVENALARCGRLGNGAVRFVVDIDYPNATTLTPSRWRGDVTIAGATRRASFTNTSGGGPNGTTQATGMVNWLQARGCY